MNIMMGRCSFGSFLGVLKSEFAPRLGKIEAAALVLREVVGAILRLFVFMM